MQHSWLPPSTARTLALLLPGQHSRLLTPPTNDGGLTHQQGKKIPLLAPVTKPSSYCGAGKGHHHPQPTRLYGFCRFLPELLLTLSVP